MLQTLRENAAVKKVVLWLVVLGMISGIGIGVTAVYESLVSGGGAGVTGGPWAMKVGSTVISPIQVQNEIRALAREYGARGLSDLPEFDKRVQADAVARLIRKTLELEEARKAGLSVSDMEVSNRIVAMPQLQRDGRFVGRDQYKAVLEKNEIDVVGFESQIREELLIQKWESLVGAGAVVTDREVEDEYRRRSDKVRFDYVVADPAKYASTITPTDAELKAHYDAHPDKYQRGEGRRARYVLIDEAAAGAAPEPTEAEIKSAYDADRPRYPGTLDQAREEVRKQLVFQRSQAEIDRKASEVRGAIGAADQLDAAAQKAGLKVEDTGIVYRDPDGLSRLGPEFIDSLFRASQGAVMGPVKMLRGSAVFVVAETQPPHRATLAEARADLVKDIGHDKGRDAAIAAARRAVSGAPGDLAAVARALGSTVKTGKLLGRDEAVPDLGYEPAAVKAAFAAPQGKIAEPVATSNGGAIVIQVQEHKTADPALLAAQRETIRGELRQGRELALVSSILEAATKKTEFKTNEQFFRQFGS